ncbi:hypothetical protein QTP88_002547 [Uroleucon formosanum]
MCVTETSGRANWTSKPAAGCKGRCLCQSIRCGAGDAHILLTGELLMICSPESLKPYCASRNCHRRQAFYPSISFTVNSKSSYSCHHLRIQFSHGPHFDLQPEAS